MHLMPRGGRCGFPDGHKGRHRSAQSIEKRRERKRERDRERWANDHEYRKRGLERTGKRYATNPKYRARVTISSDVSRRIARTGMTREELLSI